MCAGHQNWEDIGHIIGWNTGKLSNLNIDYMLGIVINYIRLSYTGHWARRLSYNHVGNNKCFDNGIRDHKNKNYRRYWLAFVSKKKKFSVLMRIPLIKHIGRNICWRDKNCNKQTKTQDCKFICRRPKNRWTSQACDKEQSDLCGKKIGAISKGVVYNCVL